MATVQVRDVPDEVAEAVAEKARAADKSVSAYLRELMMADVKQTLQRRVIEQWDAKLKETQAELGMTGQVTVSSAEVVREIREQYDRDTM